MGFLYSQFFITPPRPTKSFDGQTIIVTGANTGLGLEAVRHFVRLGASKVILACRSLAKGEFAKKSVEETTHRTGVCEVWQLDMEDFDSVKAFAKRADGLDRLDAILENAGVSFIENKLVWSEKAGMETTITVNVIGTFLLALLMVPILRKSGEKHGILPRLTITSSEVHLWAKFEERKEVNIFEAFKKDDPKYLADRYNTSKLLEVLTIRCLAERMSTGIHASQKVVLNSLTPGFCHSELTRTVTGLLTIPVAIAKFILARSTEVGSRTLVAGVAAGEESHGKWMADSVVTEPSAFVRSQEGVETGERVYGELIVVLEGIQPGITKNI